MLFRILEGGGLRQPGGHQCLFSESSEYVLEAGGLPDNIVQEGSQESEDSLASSAITGSWTPPVAPNPVIGTPPRLLHLMATMRFPRYADLQARRWVDTLSCVGRDDLNIEHGFRIEVDGLPVAPGIVRMAERVGFEPTDELPRRRFSRPLP